VVYFALTNERLQGALTLALTATPVAVALYHARHLVTLFNATASDAQRSAQGHSFGRWALAAICLAIVAQTVAALVTRAVPLAGRRRRVVGALTLAVAVVVVSVAGLAFAARYGGVGGVAHKIAHQFTSSDASANPRSSGAGRLLALGSNGRIPMVREGLKSFPHHPLAGTGAVMHDPIYHRQYGNATSRPSCCSCGPLLHHECPRFADVPDEVGDPRHRSQPADEEDSREAEPLAQYPADQP